MYGNEINPDLSRISEFTFDEIFDVATEFFNTRQEKQAKLTKRHFGITPITYRRWLNYYNIKKAAIAIVE